MPDTPIKVRVTCSGALGCCRADCADEPQGGEEGSKVCVHEPPQAEW